MENTRTLLCFLNIDRSEGRGRERERGKRRAKTHRKKYSRRKKKRNKVVWKCVLIESMYKKNAHIYTHSSSHHLPMFSFLELPHARPLVNSHTLPRRNVANKEKNGHSRTLELGYVVVEITRRKDEEFTIALL